MRPLFVIAFFTIRPKKGFGNLPQDKGGQPNKAASDAAMKAWKKFQNANGPIKDNLDLLNGAMETLLKSNSSFKVGGLIAGVVDHTYNSLINHDKDKLTISHVNDSKSNGERRILRTKAYMGSAPNKEINHPYSYTVN